MSLQGKSIKGFDFWHIHSIKGPEGRAKNRRWIWQLYLKAKHPISNTDIDIEKTVENSFHILKNCESIWYIDHVDYFWLNEWYGFGVGGTTCLNKQWKNKRPGQFKKKYDSGWWVTQFTFSLKLFPIATVLLFLRQ